MVCDDLKPLLDPFVAGGLPEGQAGLVEDHLAECEDCRKKVGLLRLNDSAVAGVLLSSGPGAKDRTKRSGFVTLLLLSVLGGLLILTLYLVYRGIDARAGGSREPAVTVRVRGQPLMDVLDEISAQAGVRVGWRRAGDEPEPAVTIRLVRPMGLSLLLAHLSDLYGVKLAVDGVRFVPPPPASPALDERMRSSRVSFHLVGSTLPEALEFLASVQAVNIILPPGTLPAAEELLVTLEAQDLPLGEVLTAILEPHGFEWTTAWSAVRVTQR